MRRQPGAGSPVLDGRDWRKAGKVGLAKTDGKYVEIPDRREAIEYSLSHAEDGDIIAIIGKGHEDYQEIEGVRYHFLDREVVQETVKKLHM